MSHEVTEDRMFVGESKPAWHGIGSTIEGLATREEAIKLCKGNYRVEKRNLYFYDENGGIRKSDAYATVAVINDTDGNIREVFLGTVGERYTPIQNMDAFCFFDPIVNDGEAVYASGGVLRDFKVFWLLAKIPNLYQINVNGVKDLTQVYILFTNSHDGTKAVTCKVTLIRVECMNTLRFALNEKGQDTISIRHTPSAEAQLKEAHRIMGLVRMSAPKMVETYDAFAKRSMDDKEVLAYVKDTFDEVFPSKEEEKERVSLKVPRVEEMTWGAFKTIMEAEGMKSVPGISNTAYGAYNGIIRYAERKVKLNQEAENPSKRLDSLWFGKIGTIRDVAYDKALALI